jgi:hypothetical protein
MSVSRSGLYSQAYLPPAPAWQVTLSVDYGSAVEWEEADEGARYILDAELMRVHVSARRDVSAGRFVQFGISLNGVFNGFADGAFDWYHSAIGIGFRGREQRPRNEFRYYLFVPQSVLLERERPEYYLGDLRFGYGIRHGSRHQTVLQAVLPTSTAPTGYAIGTWSLGVLHTARLARLGRVGFEGTVGVGYTPRKGDMEAHQLEWHQSASLTTRVSLFKQNSFYGVLFTHSSLYRRTTLPELENREWTGEFGWIGRAAGGREWRLGVTEDFGPSDSGIDLVLRFSTTWR